MAAEDGGGIAGAISERVQFILRPWKANEDNVEGLTRTYASSLYIFARGHSLHQGDPLDALAERIHAELAQDRPSMREVFALETELARVLPPEIRERRYWEHRARFERLASPRELAAYLASNPPPLPKPRSGRAGPSNPIGDADNLVLLGHVHRSYLETVLREQAERDLKHWIQRGLMRGLILYALILAALLLIESYKWIPETALYFGIGLSLFFLVGRLGAATSVVQRLQKAVREEGKDAFFEVTALCTGRRGISIAMMEGGIFAILLYIIFAAGLGQHMGMSGGIFPQVEVNSPADRAPDSGVEAGDDTPQVDGVAGSAGGDAKKDPLPDAPPLEAVDLQSTTTGDTTGAATTTGTTKAGATTSGSTTTRAATTTGTTKAGTTTSGATKTGSPTIGAATTAATTSGTNNPFGWKSDPCDSKSQICMPTFISQIGKHLGFRDYPDFFKMLLLAFLAGFAERLVPDALDRLVQRRSTVADNVAPGVATGSPGPPPKPLDLVEVNWDPDEPDSAPPPPPPPGEGG